MARRRYGLSQRRKVVGFTQESLAEHLGIDRSTVVRWEAGDSEPLPWIRPKLADTLQISVDKLTELIYPAENVEVNKDSGQNGVEGKVADDVNRRKAIALTGKALVALNPTFFDTVGQLGDRSSRGRVDKQLISAYQEITQTLAGLYRSADPRSVLPIMIAYADELVELLDEPMSDSDRSALSAMAVGAHAQAGLWACHIHLASLAYRHLATSREVAAATGDTSLRARSLGALSYLFSSAPRGGQGGNPQRCLRLLDKALGLASRSDPFTRGWLSTWRADQHATLGNLVAARADLEVAGRNLGSADQSQLEGFFSRSTYGYGMEGHLIRCRTMTFALSGDHLNLEHAFSEVLSATANLRHQVCALANLAVASAAADEPEQACDALRRSTQLAVREHYPMGVERARGVRCRFDPEWADLPATRDLDDQLRSLSAS